MYIASRPEVLVSKGVGWPNALAVDYATGEVFFGDAREDYIAAMNQDGSALRKILSRSILIPGARLHHIFALSVFEDSVYWTDWETKVCLIFC